VFTVSQLVRDLENKLKIALSQVQELNETVSQLRKDQEDLMILMTDQETKLEIYKSKLKQLGQPVSNECFIHLHYSYF
jgi:chromosome segregation ATPase